MEKSKEVLWDMQNIVSRFKAGQMDPVKVIDKNEKVIGLLRAVDLRLAERKEIVEKMCAWREAAKSSFLTVFSPSVSGTQSYLINFSLPDPSRLLFLIEDIDGRLIGNVGFCNISENSLEVDNVLRGEPVFSRDFMRDVHIALLNLAFRRLNVEEVYLNVLSDNARAIASYKKVGFEEVGSRPLVREDIPGGYRLVPVDKGGGAGAGLQRLVKMSVRKSESKI